MPINNLHIDKELLEIEGTLLDGVTLTLQAKAGKWGQEAGGLV